ncbi:hypothetical protein BKA93DRAFT_550524 [Sparassis latifolia]
MMAPEPSRLCRADDDGGAPSLSRTDGDGSSCVVLGCDAAYSPPALVAQLLRRGAMYGAIIITPRGYVRCGHLILTLGAAFLTPGWSAPPRSTLDWWWVHRMLSVLHRRLAARMATSRGGLASAMRPDARCCLRPDGVVACVSAQLISRLRGGASLLAPWLEDPFRRNSMALLVCELYGSSSLRTRDIPPPFSRAFGRSTPSE